MADATVPARSNVLADAAIDAAIGLFVLLYQPRILEWLASRLLHTSFNEIIDTATGAVVPYPQSDEFHAFLGPTMFGVAMIVSAALLVTRVRAAIGIALLLTAAVTLFNAIYIVTSYRQEGLAILSFVAVVVGGYAVRQNWIAFAGRSHVS